MSDILETLQCATGLIKTWGQSRLPKGSTLAKALTLDDIPFQGAFAVELARIYVPSTLSNDGASSGISQMIRPYLIRTRYGLKNFIHNRHSTQGCFSWPTGKTILCLDFSEHMSRDVLQYLVTHVTEQKDIKVVSVRDKSWANASVCSHQNGLYQTVQEHWDQQVDQQVSKIKQELSRAESDLRASNDLINIIRDDN